MTPGIGLERLWCWSSDGPSFGAIFVHSAAHAVIPSARAKGSINFFHIPLFFFEISDTELSSSKPVK